MKLEQKLIIQRISQLAELAPAEQAECRIDAGLAAILAENRGLNALRHQPPPAPGRAEMLQRVYTNPDATQEHDMSIIHRIFSGQGLPMRLAFATLLLLAVVALSLLLPRTSINPLRLTSGLQPAYGATEGFMLLYEFDNADLATVQPIIDQLTAAVKAFKTAHKLPDEARDMNYAITKKAEHRVVKHGGAESGEPTATDEKQKLMLAVALPDPELLDELQAELAKIPGLPEPQVKDATWFSEKGLPLPGDDAINLELGLGDKPHTFNFPKEATQGEIQQAIEEWLRQNYPELAFDVTVDKSNTGNETRMEIKIESTPDDAKASDAAKASDSAKASDTADAPDAESGASASSSSESSSSSSSESSHSESGHSSGSSSSSGGGGGGGHAGGGGGGNAGGGGSAGGSGSSNGVKSSGEGVGADSPGFKEFQQQTKAAKDEMEQQMEQWRKQHDSAADKAVGMPDGAPGGKNMNWNHSSRKSSSNAKVNMSQSRTGGGDMKMTVGLDGQEHEFSFSTKASEGEISKQVSSWLKEALPGKTYKVDVKKTKHGDKVQLDLTIERSESTEED